LFPFPGFRVSSFEFSVSEQPVSNLPKISGNFRLPFPRPARRSIHVRIRTMQDPLTGRPTRLCGSRLPGAADRAALLGGHRRRLRALDQLVAAAGQCGIRADQDRDFVLLAEDEVSLLENAGGHWAALGAAIRAFRALLPLMRLDLFGFAADGGDLFETNTPQLVRVGGGVEALAFASADASVYKFFYFREGGEVGSGFSFTAGEDGALQAIAVPGSYRLLLEKLLLIHVIGLPTEIVGLTPEGILIVKQPLGQPLPQGDDTSRLLPPGLIEIPSRFLRADRDHPRLYFLSASDGDASDAEGDADGNESGEGNESADESGSADGSGAADGRGEAAEDRDAGGGPARAWLVADFHARNFVRGADGALHVIDLVAAPWPEPPGGPLIADWLARVRADPQAGALGVVADEEL
jgi:hypothetical protein